MQAHSPKAPEHILVIEPDPDVQLALTDFMEAEGFRVRSVNRGAEAIQVLETKEPFDTILLELNLPDMEGMSLLKRVTSLDPHLPVIVLTGQVELDKQIRSFHHGVLAFVPKPYHRDQLLHLLSRALEVRKLGLKSVNLEEALKISEEQFNLTLNNINDAVFYGDLAGNIRWANSQTVTLFGQPLEKLIGSPLMGWLSPQAVALAESRLACVRAGETVPALVEFEIIQPDGTSKWIEANVSNVLRQEELVGRLLVGRDITQRKNAEMALVERNRLLELDIEVASIIDHSNDIPTLLQGCAQALVRHLDAAFARIWCLDDTKQVLQLQASAGLYTHLDGAHSRVPVGQYKIGLIAAKGKPILTNEVIGDSRIPEQAWAKREGLVAFAGYPLLSHQEVLGVMALFARHPLPAVTLNSLAAVAQRITVGIERQKVTEEKNRLTRFTQSLLNSAGEGIYGLDLDGLTTFVNPAAATMLGYTTEELLGTPMHETVHHTKSDGTPYPRETCPKYAAFKDGIVHQVEDEVLWRKDGTSFPVNYTSTPMWEGGQLVGAVVTFQDITNRKHMEKGLEHARKTFADLVNSLEGIVWECEFPSYRFTFVSQQAERLLGYPINDWLAQPNFFCDHLHEADRAWVLEYCREATLRKENHEMEYRFIHANGQEVWLKGLITVVLHEGQPIKLRGVMFQRNKRSSG